MKKLCYGLLLLVLGSGSFGLAKESKARARSVKKSLVQPPVKQPRKITIWIHGTRVASFMPLAISDRLAELEHNLLFTPAGLHKREEIDKTLYHHYIPAIISRANRNEFVLRNFYVFGWTGNLDQRDREEAGQLLCQQLKEKIALVVAADGVAPEITIITHSHGGNVVLEMAKVCSAADLQGSKIRFIALACPVQENTESYVNSGIFKSIYNIHSHQDMVQIIDPQSLEEYRQDLTDAWKDKSFSPLMDSINRVGDTLENIWDEITEGKNPFDDVKLLSGRHFDDDQSNIYQARVEWKGKAPWTNEDFAVLGKNAETIKEISEQLHKIDLSDRGLVHMEFMFPLFLKRLPYVLSTIDGYVRDGKKPTDDEDYEIELGEGSLPPAIVK